MHVARLRITTRCPDSVAAITKSIRTRYVLLSNSSKQFPTATATYLTAVQVVAWHVPFSTLATEVARSTLKESMFTLPMNN